MSARSGLNIEAAFKNILIKLLESKVIQKQDMILLIPEEDDKKKLKEVTKKPECC